MKEHGSDRARWLAARRRGGAQRCRLAAALAVLAIALPAARALAVPSFSRQMQTGCGTCHTVIPQLTPFGRKFKAEGYVNSSGKAITESWKDSPRSVLELAKVPPLAAALIASYSVLQDAEPGTKSSDVLAPDELGLYYAGKIAPGLGAFLQLSYDPQADHFSMDMMDVRYAHKTTLLGKDLVVGATLNNNPTVSDLWNSTPAYGWPFITSGVWPGEGSNAALIDNSLAQAVVGLGGYAFWNDQVYAEASAYRSAQLGVPRPYDSTTSNVIDVAAPYWRLAYDRQFGKHEVEVGTYGLYAALYPGMAAGLPLSGPSDKYLDLGFDATYQYYDDPGGTSLAVQTTYIYEHRKPSASVPDDTANLHTFRIDANGFWRYIGASAGWFLTAGSDDAAVFGTQNGKPTTTGLVLSVTARPWMNTLLVAQYTPYFRFDGASNNYDGAGRDASDNNMFSLMLWTVF